MMLGHHHKLDPQEGNVKREDENKQNLLCTISLKNRGSYGYSFEVNFRH